MQAKPLTREGKALSQSDSFEENMTAKLCNPRGHCDSDSRLAAHSAKRSKQIETFSRLSFQTSSQDGTSVSDIRAHTALCLEYINML